MTNRKQRLMFLLVGILIVSAILIVVSRSSRAGSVASILQPPMPELRG